MGNLNFRPSGARFFPNNNTKGKAMNTSANTAGTTEFRAVAATESPVSSPRATGAPLFPTAAPTRLSLKTADCLRTLRRAVADLNEKTIRILGAHHVNGLALIVVAPGDAVDFWFPEPRPYWSFQHAGKTVHNLCAWHLGAFVVWSIESYDAAPTDHRLKPLSRRAH
jgi:hypothetical protein